MPRRPNNWIECGVKLLMVSRTNGDVLLSDEDLYQVCQFR